MAKLSISLLGSFQVRLDDQPVTDAFRTEKERALLAYLAVEASRPHSREYLAELFWPERSESSARTSLRQALLGARQAIGDRDTSKPFLKISDSSLHFDLDSDHWLDTAEFARRNQIVQTHAHAAPESCLECANNLQVMVDLYRGDFLQDMFMADSQRLQEWVLFQREQYHHDIVFALNGLSTYYQHLGDFEAAHKYAWQLVNLAPMEESGHRQLMYLLAISGRRSAALAQYQTMQRILNDELGVKPSLDSIALYEKIRAGMLLQEQHPRQPTFASERQTSNLPFQLTSFVDRESELDWFARCFSNPTCRLLSLVGMPGVGKTRLAIEASTRYRDNFPDGVWLVSLDATHNPALMVPSIAQSIGLPLSGTDDPRLQLFRYLRPQKTLLILDNFEHLVSETDLLIEMLQHAPGVKLLITTRERLNFQATCLLEVHGLPYPQDMRVEHPESYGAVDLFINRAQRSRPDFELTVETLPHVVQICALVDGLPLGIELAAASLREHSLEQIASELKRNLNFLQTRLRDLPERHRSLRAAFDQSWERLSSLEKLIFQRLAVFRSSFSLEAAQAVASASQVTLTNLVDKSLLQGSPYQRYSLQPLLQHYASEKLESDPQQSRQTRCNHYQYYFQVLKGYESDLARGQRLSKILPEIDRELGNLRAAISAAMEERDLHEIDQSEEALRYFLDLRSRLQEGLDIFRACRERIGPPTDIEEQRIYGKLTAAQGWFHKRLGQLEQSRQAFEQSLDALEAAGAEQEKTFAYYGLGLIYMRMGDYHKAEDQLLKSLQIARHYNDLHKEALNLQLLTDIGIQRGEIDEPFSQLEQCQALFDRIGDLRSSASTLMRMGDLSHLQKDTTCAQIYYQRALELLEEQEQWLYTAEILSKLGALAREQGDTGRARQLLHESLAAFRTTGDLHRISQTLQELGELAVLEGQFPEASRSFHEALQIAVDTGGTPSILNALYGIASLLAELETTARAVELLTLVGSHPASPRLTKNRAEALLDALQTRLDPQVYEKASQRVTIRLVKEIALDFLGRGRLLFGTRFSPLDFWLSQPSRDR